MITLSIDRTTIKKGPCLIISNGLTIYSKDDVTITPQKSTWDLPTSLYGKQTDRRLKDAWFKVSFQADGEVSAALLAMYYASSLLNTGQSIFGQTDVPLTIISLNDTVNNQVIMRCTAVSKPPELNFRTDQTLFGPVEFSCIGARNTSFNSANRFAYINTKALNGTITGVTNANPAVLSSAALPATGDPISISGVVGNTAVNINGYAQSVNSVAGTFEISTDAAGQNLVAGSGAYTSGGTWSLGWPMMIQNAIASPFAGAWATTVPTGTATVTQASPAVLTCTNHGLVVGDPVLNSGYANAALNGAFYVISTTTNTYELSATQGGAAINNTVGADSGTFLRTRPLDLFDTEEGIQVTFDVSLTPKRTNSLGTYDILFSSLTVHAKGLPVSSYGGPDVTDILSALNLQGTSVQLGQSMAAEGQNLKLAGNGIYFWLYQASVDVAPTIYSAEKLRPGDFQWTATRSYTGNTANPLFKVSTTPINS